MPPRKHIVSARIKSPNEGRGFCSHFCKALKRTVIYMIFVALISAVLYFTDGLWQCTAPYTLTPMDLSSLHKRSQVNTPEGDSTETGNTEEGYELMFVDHLFDGLISGPESFEFYQDSIITSTADGKVVMLYEKSNSSETLYSRCETFTNETVTMLVICVFLDGCTLLEVYQAGIFYTGIYRTGFEKAEPAGPKFFCGTF